MSSYETEMAEFQETELEGGELEGGELEGGELEGGELEGGEFEGGELEGGELEVGELGEAGHQEQFLGGILGSLLGGEVGSGLHEAQEVQLASELLEISSEQELEQFLGKIFKNAVRGVGSFMRSPAGQALGGILKNVAKKALPVVGGALGSMVAPGIGTALGSKLGSMASGLFEVNAEAMPAEQAELEVARRYVRLASSAARQLAAARPRVPVSPRTVARAAVARAARVHAPGIYRRMMTTLRTGAAPRRVGYAGYGYGPRPLRWRRRVPAWQRRADGWAQPPYDGVGYGPWAPAPDVEPVAPAEPGFEPAYRPAPTAYGSGAGYAGTPTSGRWIRRGRKIVLLGV